jgi:adenylylsulfate kinase
MTVNKKAKNIFPVFHRMLTKEDKEKLLRQRGVVLWFTGLSGSGKSTLAIEVEKELYTSGYLTQILDGDNIRSGLNANLGFSEEDRKENIRRIAEVAKLFANCGIVTLTSFVSPTREIRSMAKNIIGENLFMEIYVNAPLEVCEERDVKGLYKKARAGEIKDFTGIHQPFEAPENPFLEIHTDQMSIEQAKDLILRNILPYIRYDEQE